MKKTFLKKTVLAIVTSSFFFAVLFSSYSPFLNPQPKIAHAFPAFEINPAIVTGVTVTAAAQTTQTVILQALNGLAWGVAKMAVQSITRSTVNWINSGFKGSPAFVTDLNANLKALGDAVSNQFFQNLNRTVVDTTGFNIKSPFQDQINQKLRNEYYRTTASWGLNYTLSQTAKDPKAYLNGNFNDGGFNAFFSASQNPSNNPFGAYTLASNELWSEVDKAGQQRRAEVQAGSGFLSWRGDCPASTGNAAKDAVALSTAEKCPFNSIRTPGSLINAQLVKVAGASIDQLDLADSINEIVAALMGQLVNQVLGSGGLLGVSQPSAGGGSSYLTQATDPAQYSQVVSTAVDGIIQNMQTDITSITQFQQNWQKVLGAADAAQQACNVRPEITTVQTKATTGITEATAAITNLNQIMAYANQAKTNTSATQAVMIASTSAAYTSALTAPPTGAELVEASIESADTSDDASTTPSLYTQMQKLASSCRPGT